MKADQWLGWESAQAAQAALLAQWDPPKAASAAAKQQAAMSGGRVAEVRAGARIVTRFGDRWTGGVVLAPNTAMFKIGVPMWEVRYEDGLTMGAALAETCEGADKSWRMDSPRDYAARARVRLEDAGLTRPLEEGARLPPSTTRIEPGLQVQARFRRSTAYFTGVVVHDNGDGTLGIAFGDGDWDPSVPRKAVRGKSRTGTEGDEGEEGKEGEGEEGAGGKKSDRGRKRGRADGASSSSAGKHPRPVGPAAARAAAEEAAQAKARAKARAAPALEVGARVEAEWERRQWFAAVVTKRYGADKSGEWLYDVVYDDGAHDYKLPREKLMPSSKPHPKHVGRRPKKQRTAQQIKTAASHDVSELWAARSPRPGTVTGRGGRKAAFDAAPRDLSRSPLAGNRANTKQCGALFSALRRRADCWMFEQPVAPQLEPSLAAAYMELVTTPMELSSVSKKLDLDGYAHIADFVADLRLVWANALLFNKDPKDAVNRAARGMSHAFEQELGRRLSTWEGPMSTDFLEKCPFEVLGADMGQGGAAAAASAERSVNNNNGKLCHRLVADLLKHPLGHFFSAPVDAEALGLDDYAAKITSPMDLGTVLAKLGAQRYSNALGFASDVRQVWANAIAYNEIETHQVHRAAKMLAREFEAKLGRASLHSTWEPEEDQRVLDSDEEGGGYGGGHGGPAAARGSSSTANGSAAADDDDDDWKSEGHEWIGRRVLRRLTNKKGSEIVMAGTISRWAPETDEDEALWHMAHDDGDAEDLDEDEAKEAIAAYEAEQQGA